MTTNKSTLFLLVFITVGLIQAMALETPTSDGSVALMDNPVFRIPMLKKAPQIDGQISNQEWSDASALSGFWSNNVKVMMIPRWEHLAPHQIQSQVYGGYDRDHLYILYKIKIYPNKAWLKARGRFPDVWKHPLYGLKQDDHIEFELRPTHDLVEGQKQGFFKWFVNPTSVVSDQHYSILRGHGKSWQGKAKIRSGTTAAEDWWFVEMAIPFKEMRHWGYAGKNDKGQDRIQLPPPDGTTYRVWFKNGIGGLSAYVVLFDQHAWRVTKTKMILDSKAVSFQINDLGPMMEDIVDVKLTLKNHNTKSETVRLGFFVENAEGTIFSSYEQEQTQDGLVELRPGETKQIHYKKKFPGISGDNNWLWFDVRTAGRPAKVLFQNRLVKFHSTEPPAPYHVWRERKLKTVEIMRPAKQDFDFRYQYSPYKNRVSGIVDIGIHGVSDEAARAKEVHVQVLKDNEDEDEVVSTKVKFKGSFATFLMDMPHDLPVGRYKISVLLFDEDQMIVGERNPKSFYKGKFKWERNTLGKQDIVWEPFTPIKLKDHHLDTLKIRHEIADTGFPQQIHIKTDEWELPLEYRDGKRKITKAQMKRIGRGDQLRAPMRLEVVVDGERKIAKAIHPAKVARQWKSEIEYEVNLEAGPLKVKLQPQYDCDGTIFFKMKYGSDAPVKIDLMEMVMDVGNNIDTRIGGMYGMVPFSGAEITLPKEEGIVWDSAKNSDLEDIELYYSRFVPYFYFGNGDMGFTWVADSDKNWMIDRDGSTMTLERDKKGNVTWRIKFINHRVEVVGHREVEFVMITHPTKPKEKGHRNIAWLHSRFANLGSDQHIALPNDGPGSIQGSDETFEYFTKAYPNGGPILYINTWLNSGDPEVAKGAYTGEWMLDSSKELNSSPMDELGGYGQPWKRPGAATMSMAYGCESFTDYYVYHLEKQIRVGKVTGWWWDEMALPRRGDCVANGMAYFRDPMEIGKNELPYQANFGTKNIMLLMKRLARIQKENQVPNLNQHWATNHAALFESYSRESRLVEYAGAYVNGYEVDNITKYPLSFFRFACGTNRSLTVSIQAGLAGPKAGCHIPGDTLRHDRSFLGRALLHDVGLENELVHIDQHAKVLNAMREFGLFDIDGQTEVIPYWRSGEYCRFGEERIEDDDFSDDLKNPNEKVHVTIYRRPFRTHKGKTGYKALFVILNESEKDARGRLHVLDSKNLFGGENNLDGSLVYKNLKVHSRLSKSYFSRYKAMMNLEDGSVLSRSIKGARWQEVEQEIYGPLFVGRHDFRMIYGHYNPAVKRQKFRPIADTRFKQIQFNRTGEKWWKEWDRELGIDKKSKASHTQSRHDKNQKVEVATNP